ncbi:MAG: hypothetical protein ACXVSL_11445 [Solirubrobacteraceae bacterium]
MSTSDDQPSIIELIELSDLAWTIINGAGEHEPIEQAWTEALPDDWAPAEGIEELRARLGEITETVRGDRAAALLEVVSAVIVYLAAHPECRRMEQAVISKALHEEYGERVPDEIASWLATHAGVTARTRHHGAPARRRHLHSRPLPPAEAS